MYKPKQLAERNDFRDRKKIWKLSVFADDVI